MARLLVVSRSMALALRLADTHDVVERPVEALDGLVPPPDVDALVLDVGDPGLAVRTVDRLRGAGDTTPMLVVAGYQPEWTGLTAVDVPDVVVVPLPVTRAALLDGIEALVTGNPAQPVAGPATGPATGSVRLAGLSGAAGLGDGLVRPYRPSADHGPAHQVTADVVPQPAPQPAPQPGAGRAPADRGDGGWHGTGFDWWGGPPGPGPGTAGKPAPSVAGPAATAQAPTATAKRPPSAAGTTRPAGPGGPDRHAGSGADEPGADDPGHRPRRGWAVPATAIPSPARPRPGGPVAAAVGRQATEGGRADRAPGGAAPAPVVLGTPGAGPPELPAPLGPGDRRPVAAGVSLGHQPFVADRAPADRAPADGREPLLPPDSLHRAATDLVTALVDRIGEVVSVAEAGQAVADRAVAVTASQACAVLVPDGDLWRVGGGVGLREPEHRLVLGASHRLLEMFTPDDGRPGVPVVLDGTGPARHRPGGLPLSGWRYLLGGPVPGVGAVVLLARGTDARPYGPPEAQALREPLTEAAPLLRAALHTRHLARLLAPLRDLPHA